jgi:SAM-dependent methyltransferase
MTAPAASDRPIPASSIARDPGSYRDPSGFVYRREGVLLRQVDRSFATEWDAFTSSGLHARLVQSGRLIAAEVVGLEHAATERAHAVLRPEELDFVSYPYEWTFGQLKDAALLTLETQGEATKAGFTLRDASAYNVQFRRGRPILIDSLSFEPAEPDAPWQAYRQFCEHFLAPLALMALRDVRLGLLLRDFLDGIPLDLAASLLPGRSRLNVGLASHVHLHARAQRRYADRADGRAREAKVGATRRAALLDSLRRTVEGLDWRPEGTEWADYAEHTSYSDDAARAKDEAVRTLLAPTGARRVWDLGANTGRFSRIAADTGATVLAFDIDPAAAERHYREIRRTGEERILPLVVDLANPSPGIGWANAERRPLLERADADAVLALALVHHLAIGRNVPLPYFAELLAGLARHAIVEFVPKDDPMVRRLLATRRDVFPDYTLAGFRAAVAGRFEIAREVPLAGSPRVLVHLVRRDAA